MKRYLPLAFTVCLVLALTIPAAWAVEAVRTTSTICVDDKSVTDNPFDKIAAYNIGGNNYFRIRDLAEKFNGTGSQFNVVWNAAANQVELLTGQPYVPEETERVYFGDMEQAIPASAALLIDGQAVPVTAYNIKGSNFYKLRDLSSALSFEPAWIAEKNTVCIYTGMDGHARLTSRTVNPFVIVNETDQWPKANMRYVEKASPSSFSPFWAKTSRGDDGHGTGANTLEDTIVKLENLTGGAGGWTNTSTSTAPWGWPVRSYLYEENGTLRVLDATGTEIVVDTYDPASLTLLSTQKIPMELAFFGGFYAGERYNYIVFGQNDLEHAEIEVMRVVKYDKQFNRLASISVEGDDPDTALPFQGGSVRMAEHGNELIVHTCVERYSGHQMQFTMILDTDTMQSKETGGKVGDGEFYDQRVSHSFNQFVRYDGTEHVLIDHGDGYPRSIVLHRGNGFPPHYTVSDLLKIPGMTGSNYTGICLGGFEISSSSYLVAMNSIDLSRRDEVRSDDNGGQGERNIVLLVCGKNELPAGDTSNTFDLSAILSGNPQPETAKELKEADQVVLTDYIGHNKMGSIPYLVKISEDRFLVLWEEFEHTLGAYDQTISVSRGVHGTIVDGQGQIVSQVPTLENAHLSTDCQPIVFNGQVIWWVNTRAGRMFYSMDI